MNTYEVSYLEGEFGRMITTEVRAEDEAGAIEEAQEDYYFMKLILVELLHEGSCDE